MDQGHLSSSLSSSEGSMGMRICRTSHAERARCVCPIKRCVRQTTRCSEPRETTAQLDKRVSTAGSRCPHHRPSAQSTSGPLRPKPTSSPQREETRRNLSNFKFRLSIGYKLNDKFLLTQKP